MGQHIQTGEQGVYAVAQGTQYELNYTLGNPLLKPTLFFLKEGETTDTVRVETWGGTTLTIDAQELTNHLTLIRKVLDHADTKLTVSQFYLQQ